ncbi:MAG: hypothetical protein AAFX55_07815 [Bacteroidota bacterium]
MKNLKFVILSMFVALFVVTSCTNNEPVDDGQQQQTEESTSITTALSQLSTQFDLNGNISVENNPAGNIVLDFCFDFVYPLTLSYNNGTTVTVEDLDGLIEVMLGSTDELYINGIAFPFDVETFDDDTDSIEVETIDDEEEFIELLLSCAFDDDDIDDCDEDYDPVCVVVTDPSGETFVVTYPNECYAIEDGFTENDFVDDCEDDYYVGGGVECFELNFPVSVITENGDVITINSEEELATALYDVYVFDFVYPITVTLGDETVVTINDPEDIEDILEDCYDDYDDYDDDECEECEDQPIDPVCIEMTTATGETVVEVFPNLCFALCLGFDESDVVDCENDGSLNCDENDIVSNLAECEWYVYASLLSQNEALDAIFNADGTLTVELGDGTAISGTWEIVSNPTGVLSMSFVLPEPLDAISNLDWTVAQCSEEYILLESNNEFIALEKDCD